MVQGKAGSKKMSELKQRKFLFFFQVFLDVLFFFALGLFFAFGSTLGRPRVPPSRIASIAFSRYIPAEPMYLKGSTPFRLSLILTAADEMPSRWAISNTVIPSIHLSISGKSIADQVKIAKMLQHCHIFLHICIVKTQKICEFLKIFSPTLDYPLGLVYYVIMLQHCNIIKNGNGATESRKGSTGAKGECYERVQKFSGMA